LSQSSLKRPQSASAKRIVAASVKEYHVEPSTGALHLPENQTNVLEFKVKIRFTDGICIYGDEVVCTAHLQAVASIVKQPNFGSLKLSAESSPSVVESGFVQVYLCSVTHYREAQGAQCVRHKPRVARRVI